MTLRTIPPTSTPLTKLNLSSEVMDASDRGDTGFLRRLCLALILTAPLEVVDEAVILHNDPDWSNAWDRELRKSPQSAGAEN